MGSTQARRHGTDRGAELAVAPDAAQTEAHQSSSAVAPRR
jgi:hypothetical protein